MCMFYPKDPWEWYIYRHEWLIFMVHVCVCVNVGKDASPMDPMGRMFTIYIYRGMPKPWNNEQIVITLLVGAVY